MTARDTARMFDLRRIEALERARTADDIGACSVCMWPVEELVWLDDQLACIDCHGHLTAEPADDADEVAA